MKFETPGLDLKRPTRRVRMIKVNGIKEKINPKAQELALSKRLFSKKFTPVK
jgi:hypothetical protein